MIMSKGVERRAWFVLAMILWVVLASLVLPPHTCAQEPEGTQVQPQQPESFFVHYAKVAGLIGVVIVLLSIYLLANVGRLFFEFRHEVAMPPSTVNQCEELLRKREFMGIYNLLKEDGSFFSRVLTTGITELPNGLREAREAMEGVGEALTVGMEKKISVFAVLGTLGPMIGLLGTLKGMITSFDAIARHGTQLKAQDVALGISEALVLTLLGVFLSVLAIPCFAFFRNRVATISVDTLLRADEFLRHFAHATRKKGVSAASSPSGAATAN